jgi:hypothetical protein
VAVFQQARELGDAEDVVEDAANTAVLSSTTS